MAGSEPDPTTPPVVDRRPVPRGVLPRGVQTWLMVAIAAGMLLIILLTGHRDPGTSPRQSASSVAPASPDRVRDYQERLRLLDEQAARDAQEAAAQAAPTRSTRRVEADGQKPQDPLAEERRRREYDSLFASNIVMSRRPQAQRPDAGASRTATPDTERRDSSPPTLDEIAAAVVRASGPTAKTPAPMAPTPPEAQPSANAPMGKVGRTSGPIDPRAALQRLLEGTVIDAVLTNRLDGATAAPVVCLVTNPVYSHSGQDVLLPAGAKVIGETRPVQSLGETRLAVAFHRILMPDGSAVSIEQFRGLNQIEDSGLRDRVNQHYLSTFGAAGAVGLISGLSQLLATAGMGVGDGDGTVVIAGNVTDAASQASSQVMNRFLNRLPTVTIREGHRIKIYVTADLDLPAWRSPIASASTNQGGM